MISWVKKEKDGQPFGFSVVTLTENNLTFSGETITGQSYKSITSKKCRRLQYGNEYLVEFLKNLYHIPVKGLWLILLT